MSEAKFTKGGWVLNSTGFYGEFDLTTKERVEDSKVAIVTIDTSYSGYIGDEQTANAHLIVTSPEMYEFIETYMGGHPEAEALLAKARGEQDEN